MPLPAICIPIPCCTFGAGARGPGGLIGLALLIFWIWVLVDCLRNEPSRGHDRLIWVLVILLGNFIGAAIYFFLRRPQRQREFGR